MARRWLWLGLAVVVGACWGMPAAAVPAFPAGDEPTLEVELVAPTGPVRAGEPAQIGIILRNAGRQPLVLLKPIDGHDFGWRKVRYSWTVTRDGKPVPAQSSGLPQPLQPPTAADFVILKRNEEYRPVCFISLVTAQHDMREPGTYKLQLTYRFDPKATDKAGAPGKADPKAAALLVEAAAVEVTSAPIALKLLPLQAPPAQRGQLPVPQLR